MAEEVQGLATTILVAALSGGAISAFVSSISESRRSEKAVLRAKLEELHSVYDHHYRALNANFDAIKRYVNGEINAHDMFEESSSYTASFGKVQLDKIEVLSALYFPDLNIHIASYQVAQKKFQKSFYAVSKISAADKGWSEVVKLVNEGYAEFLSVGATTRKAILDSCKSVNKWF